CAASPCDEAALLIGRRCCAEAGQRNKQKSDSGGTDTVLIHFEDPRDMPSTSLQRKRSCVDVLSLWRDARCDCGFVSSAPLSSAHPARKGIDESVRSATRAEAGRN